MNGLNAIFIFAAAYISVFLQASCDFFRHWLGAQISLLPALMVYASLTHGLSMIALLAVGGGLLVDSLSANPLGASVLPLFVAGVAIFVRRDLLLRYSATAQLILGTAASAFCPAATLFLLLNSGHGPKLGWVSSWQILLGAALGGVLTPGCFILFDRFHHAFDYPSASSAPFRADREIKRGRF
jgi:hypothetical protein